MDDYLRFEILKYLAYNGRVSKTMAEKAFDQHKHITKTNRLVRHHHQEISDGFKYLQTKGLIVKMNTDPGQGKVYGRGRPQKYYEITEYGLKKLIADKRISKTQFWNILYSYCLRIDAALTLEKLEELLHIFIYHYMRFRNYGFTSYFEAFHTSCNHCFKEGILVSDGIPIFQKVLEVLAINPNITIDKLAEKVGESESSIKKVLSLYSYKTPGLIGEHHNKVNLKFMTQNIIIINNNGGSTYELSLFGVMLTLRIILYNNIRELKHGLFLRKYSFQKYCDIIANNYSHKLPLVFGKWAHLRHTLQVIAIYNFDLVLLDEVLVERSNSFSIIAGGNKELFQGIHTIIQYNNNLMQDLVRAGMEVFPDYFSARRLNLNALRHLEDDIKLNKIYPLCAMLEELFTLLDPLLYRYPYRSAISSITLDPNRILKQMEVAFGDEISAFYYMNLLNDNIYIKDGSNKLFSLEPRRRSLLFQEDKIEPLIIDQVKKWTGDLSSIYKQIYETMERWSSPTSFA